jgi:hypothetical protein
MKKISLFALLAALVMSVNAAEIWQGSQRISWDLGGLQLAPEAFADAQPGNLLKVSFTGATDGIEFKVMNEHFDHLAGSREAAWISGDGAFEQFLTEQAVKDLKLYGLEIIGANFTCTMVELLDGKVGNLKEGYNVWTGFFWADNWTTLELYRDGYSRAPIQFASALRIYSEAWRSNFVINIKDSWEEGGQIADQSAMIAGDGYMELPLTDELRARLANAGHWMIQFNKEAGEAFNVTDIVLVVPTYTVAGSESVFGSNWNINAEENDMIFADSIYVWSKIRVALPVGKVEFKVVKNHSWDEAYPKDNYVLDIDSAGIYTIVISFSPADSLVKAIAIKTADAVIIPTIVMHGNFSGAWEDTEEFVLSADSASASLDLEIAEGNYEFGVKIAGNWTSNGFEFTRENNSAEIVAGEGNLKLIADVAGIYTFTWNFESNTLSILFPNNQAVENVSENAKAVKMVVDGQIVIIKNDKRFNVLGTEMK